MYFPTAEEKLAQKTPPRWRRFLFGSKRRTIVTIAVATLILASISFAAWVLTASNTKWTSKTATLSAVTFSPTAYPAQGQLFPGGSVPLKADANNPNAIALIVTGATGTPTVNSALLPGGCSPSDFSVNMTAFTGLPIAVGASTLSAPGALSMSASAPTACQGASVEVTIPTLTYGTS